MTVPSQPGKLVHEMAWVWDASIGEGTRVWQFASVIRGAVVGRGCSIASCAIIDGARIGDRCLIGHGSSVHPGTVLGDDVFVGPGVVFCNDAWPSTSKEGFDVREYIDGRRTSVRVHDGVSIGAGCVVLPGVSIGAGSVVAAGSRVDVSIPAHSLLKPSGEVVLIAPRVPERMRQAPL